MAADSNQSLDQKIEAILFYKAAPVSRQSLAKLLAVTDEQCSDAIAVLQQRLRTGATRIITTTEHVELVTAPEFDELLSTVRTEEFNRSIGKAGAETLAIVLYRGPVTRSEIDRIRGVNSAQTLRTLAVRGLVTATSRKKRTEYRVTSELLAHLGITSAQELPGYTETLAAIETYESTS